MSVDESSTSEASPEISDLPEPIEERWVFGGSRIGTGGKRIHAWVPEGTAVEDAVFFSPSKGMSPAVGSIYAVQVRRVGKRVTRFGDPVYLKRSDDEALRGELELAHRLAEVELSRRKQEANDKRATALDEAMAPLLELARTVSPFDRDAFLVMVIRRVEAGLRRR